MKGFIVRRWRSGALMAGVMFLALPASGALASGTPSNISVGPAKMHAGFKLYIFASCNAKAYADVSVQKGGLHYSLSHYYYNQKGGGASCKTSKKLSSASLTMGWGPFVRGSLKFTPAGAVKRLKPPKGCTTTYRTRKMKGTGTLRVSIHTNALGKLVLHHVSAIIGSGKTTCKTPPPPPKQPVEVNLSGSWHDYTAGFTAADVNNQQHRSVYFFAPDNLSKEIGGALGDSFSGTSSLFSYSSDLSSAKLGSASPYLSGSLTYSASSGCSSGDTFGTLSGTLTLKDPVTGTEQFPGSTAEGPFMQRSNGSC